MFSNFNENKLKKKLKIIYKEIKEIWAKRREFPTMEFIKMFSDQNIIGGEMFMVNEAELLNLIKGYPISNQLGAILLRRFMYFLYAKSGLKGWIDDFRINNSYEHIIPQNPVKWAKRVMKQKDISKEEAYSTLAGLRYKIGNGALLPKDLNEALHNYEIDKKMEEIERRTTLRSPLVFGAGKIFLKETKITSTFSIKEGEIKIKP